MSYSFKTFLKHTAKDFHNQSVNPPVVRASTIIFKSMQDIRKTQNKAKKNSHFSTKPIFLAADLEMHVFMFFYHSKCSQTNSPMVGSVFEHQKHKTKHKKTSFFEPSN